MPIGLQAISNAAADALVQASTCFRPDQKKAYEHAIERETNPNARWLLETILENAAAAEKSKLPLCDDTGIPHVVVEVGDDARIQGNVCDMIQAVNKGITNGLRALPGRPMGVKGNDLERIDQSQGLYEDSGMVVPAPLRIEPATGNQIRITVLMLGGGSEIRSRTYRVFHHHSSSRVSEQVAQWGVEMAGLLGCTPCIPAVGIGRTHYEATCLMLDAMAHKDFGNENEMEQSITRQINQSNIGPLGTGGSITALNSFVKVGPQRASGVRIVCLRLGCCIDPRRSTIVLQ